MGAGQLNTARAVRQFSSGEYELGETIPNIGWAYDETGGQGTTLTYPFSAPVGGGYIAITLAWDRGVIKNGGSDATYDPSNTFTGGLPEDLDLFLCQIGWDNPYEDAVAASHSSVESVEHIFAEVPSDDYEIVVFQATGGDKDIGLAWWFGSDIPGDFDDDGDVDDADFGEFKSNFGLGNGADADFDGDSDGADFLAWQHNYGTGVPPNAAAPEPAALTLAAIGLPLLVRRRVVA
jgi:hypothetical protein